MTEFRARMTTRRARMTEFRARMTTRRAGMTVVRAGMLVAIKSPVMFLVVLLGILLFAFAPGQWTPAWVVNHDKFVHAVVFFGLSVLLSLVFPRLKLFQHFVGLMFFAVLIEGIQYALANRGFSFEDIAFDLIGVVVFYIVVYSVKLLSDSKFN